MLVIDKEKCVGCGLCVKDCLSKAMQVKEGHAEWTKNCFRCGHCIAICPVSAISTSEEDQYSMDDVVDVVPNETTIPGEQMLRVIKCRRSIRNFRKQKVEREKLEMILEAGRFSPTGSNAQNVSYIVIQDTMDEFNKEAMRCFRSYNSDERFNLLFAPPFTRDRIDFSNDDFLFKGADTVILLVTPSDVNAGIAGTSMELTANGLGVGMLYVGFFKHLATKDPQIREYLGLKEGEQIGAVLAMGYPDVEYKRSVPRKPLRVSWR